MAVDDRRHVVGALRTSAWRGDRRIAVLSPAPARPTPTAAVVAGELEVLRRRGVERVVTGALHPHEVGPFEAAGFIEQERLHLLRHDLVVVPEAATDVTIRRGRRRDRGPVLELDARAFDDFWTLDAEGLADAISATPTSRFRVAGGRAGPIVGYSVTGVAGRRGYLQRLAVEPDHHGRGLGRALVVQSLTWLRRAGADHAIVNTQERNEGAFHLYLRCGFVPEPDWLTVLTRSLVDDDPETGP